MPHFYVLRVINSERKYTCMNRLRELRNNRELSLEAVEKLTGIIISQLSKFERGAHNPSVITAIKLAKFYRTSVESIWGDNQYEQRD